MEGYFKEVFKYEKFEVCKLILNNKTLRFTKPTKFEDLLDCSEQIVGSTEDIVYDAVNRKFQNAPTLFKGKIISEALIRYRSGDEKIRKIFLEERVKIIVTCFSKRSNNEYLWEKYAKNHTGLCLEFFLEKQFQLNSLGEIYPLEVKYYPQDHKIMYKHGDLEWIGKWITAKSLKYFKEEEIRWLFIGVNLNGDFLDIVYPQKLLKKVIFGKKVELGQRKEIINLVSNNFKEYNIQFAEIVLGKNNGLLKEVPFIP